nr:histidine kinase [Nocardia sp. XZ_19_231]
MLNSYLFVVALVSVRISQWAAAVVWFATVVAGATAAVALRPPSAVSEIVGGAALCALVLVAGGAVGGLIEARGRLAEQEAQTERERERHTVLAERTRIARELHDVVVHHMSVVAIQAQAAQFRIDNPPPELLAGLATIHASASAAMTEMRRILGVLRADDSGTTDPPPSLADVDRLVEAMRATGVHVEQRTTGPVRPLPGPVEVSAYRIVQESLSNAVRHAPGSEIVVIVRYGSADVGIEIRNGPSASVVPSRGPGHGLVGMRERTDILGGSFTAEPTTDGGYRVTTRLPI